ncbi:MAG TPA: oxygenase MpaB family protein [Micromonosporaceae bacterium]
MDRHEDLGLFGPGSVTWRVHAEPILALAGLRSLFLQALHPRAVAGVMQNSGYKTDPWGRLVRTINYVATAVFGTTAQAEAAGRRVRSVHAQLTARDPRTGETFRIDEPALLRWVHVSEVESFLDTARRAGVALTSAEVDAYYTEQRRVAALVGLDPSTVPGTAAEVDAYYREIRPELAMTRDAAETLFFLSAPPLPRRLGFTPARLVYFGIAATAFGLLPPWARRMYGMFGLPTTDLSASLSARTMRLALNALPHKVYEGPLYRSAMARAELASRR